MRDSNCPRRGCNKHSIKAVTTYPTDVHALHNVNETLQGQNLYEPSILNIKTIQLTFIT